MTERIIESLTRGGTGLAALLLRGYHCGLGKPTSRDTIERFLIDFDHVIDDIFNMLVKQAAARGLLDSTYSIDSTHVEAIQYNDASSWKYKPIAEEYYYGFGCTIVSTGAKIAIAAEFTQAKQAVQETVMRVTRDALPSSPQSGCSETVLTTSSTNTTTAGRRSRASRPLQTTKH